MQGRVHGYEGWSAEDVAFGARVLCGLGVKLLLVTNAAGGVNPSLAPGDLVRITDHLNLSGLNPLVGENDDRLGPRFPDMTEAYDPRLGALLDEARGRARHRAPLAASTPACSGPSYETPAEVRMLRALGADVVGMSTVPEVIAARHMGVRGRRASRSSRTSPRGSRARPLSHEEVAETAGAGRASGSRPLVTRVPRPRRCVERRGGALLASGRAQGSGGDGVARVHRAEEPTDGRRDGRATAAAGDDDRRDSQRVPIHLLIRDAALGGSFEPYEGNLALGGVWFDALHPPVGSRVEVRFLVPGRARRRSGRSARCCGSRARARGSART